MRVILVGAWSAQSGRCQFKSTVNIVLKARGLKMNLERRPDRAWGVTFRRVLCKGSLAEKGCGTRKVSGPGERDVVSRVARSPRARCSTVRRRSVVSPCACSALGLSLFHVLLFRRAQKPVIPAALLSLPSCPFPQVKSLLGWFPTPALFLPCVSLSEQEDTWMGEFCPSTLRGGMRWPSGEVAVVPHLLGTAALCLPFCENSSIPRLSSWHKAEGRTVQKSAAVETTLSQASVGSFICAVAEGCDSQS